MRSARAKSFDRGLPIATLAGGAYTDLIYAGGSLIAEVGGTQTAAPTYRVSDYLGSLGGSLTTANAITNPMNYAPYGQQFTGTTSDPFGFTGLQWDATTATNHATARQFSIQQGRWQSPDHYSSSYDWANPQSLNRYAYVNGMPTLLVDPTGQGGEGAVFCSAGPIACIGGLALSAIVSDLILNEIFGRSTFHGSTEPRPNANPWNDKFGVPYTGLGSGIAQALGLPTGGCEFGACAGLGDSFASPANTSISVYCRGIEFPIPGTKIPLGTIGAQHCDAWVQIGGVLYTISGGPIPPSGPNQVLRMFAGQAKS